MLSGEIANSPQPKTFVQKLKRAGADLLGRERANRLSGPIYDWLAHRQGRRFLQNLNQRDLRVNLGCGYNPLAGWVNVDAARGPQVDLVWDLRGGLPFTDESCALIFSEHVIEHLNKDDGQHLLNECYRVLKPGSVLRISTPDAGLYLRSYAGDCEFLNHPEFTQEIQTPLDRVNQMMREYGQHLWVYDSASLQLALKKAGFNRTIEQIFGKSIHNELRGIDSESRAFESLYGEAVK